VLTYTYLQFFGHLYNILYNILWKKW